MDEIRFDRVALKADVREDGLIYDSPILSRVGVFKYRDAAYPGGFRKEFRPPEEVFHKDHLASLRGRPITNNHPKGMIHSRSDQAPMVDSRGKPWQSIGSALSEGRQDTNGLDMLGDVVIHHTDAVLKGAKELSLGYRLKLDHTPGVWNGEPYDCIQREMRVDHIACVPVGRAGNARLNLDAGDLDEEPPMADPKLVTVRLDSGLEYQASPEVEVALRAALAKAGTEATRADAAVRDVEAGKGKLDGVQAELDALKLKIEKFRADAVETVKVRMVLESTAKEVGVEVRADASDLDVRKAIIAKLSPKINLDGKSEAYIDAMADHLLGEAAERKTNVSGQRRTADPTPGVRSDSVELGKGTSARDAQHRMTHGAPK